MNGYKVSIDCEYCPERRVIVHGDAAAAVLAWIAEHADAHRDDEGKLLDAKIMSMADKIQSMDDDG